LLSFSRFWLLFNWLLNFWFFSLLSYRSLFWSIFFPWFIRFFSWHFWINVIKRLSNLQILSCLSIELHNGPSKGRFDVYCYFICFKLCDSLILFHPISNIFIY
jgi:hypothetical protein